MKTIRMALLATAAITFITGCSTETRVTRAPQPPPPATTVQSPARQVPAKRGIVAVVARSAPEATEAQRKFTQALTKQLRTKLAEDTTITTLPSTVTDDAISGLVIHGFVSGNEELKKAASKLPAECNIVIVVGPYPGDSGWFPIFIARRRDLAAAVFRFGPPKGDTPTPDEVTQSVGMVRYDIDEVLKQSE